MYLGSCRLPPSRTGRVLFLVLRTGRRAGLAVSVVLRVYGAGRGGGCGLGGAAWEKRPWLGVTQLRGGQAEF